MSTYYREKWKEIHTKALQENNEDYCKYIRELILPCHSCRAHFQHYLTLCPPEAAQDLFIWSWEFHNNVNRRLGKKIIGLEVARVLYTQ